MFVSEYLALRDGSRKLVRGLAKGRDGAIDLVNLTGDANCFVECKFIGKDTAGTATSRWTAVENHLRKNLPAAASGESGVAKAYRPWLCSNGPVEHYYFCTSTIMGNTQNRTDLVKRIKGFFADITVAHDELLHLADLTVEVLYWDDFVADSSKFVPLFYRWFGGYPHGYGELNTIFEQTESSFKRFLDSTNLPFFSRSAFAEYSGRETPNGEEELLDFLISGSTSRALVISGPGGIGKPVSMSNFGSVQRSWVGGHFDLIDSPPQLPLKRLYEIIPVRHV